jgi:hypothetical protein
MNAYIIASTLTQMIVAELEKSGATNVCTTRLFVSVGSPNRIARGHGWPFEMIDIR